MILSNVLYITPELDIKFMKIKEMITENGSSWLLHKFFLWALREMSKKQFEEYAYWYWGVKNEVEPHQSNIFVVIN